MLNIIKKITFCFCALVIVSSLSFDADDRTSNNYNYDAWGNEIDSAPTFTNVYTIDSQSTGEKFGEIVDVVAYNDDIYIVDQTNAAIYVLNKDYQVVNKIKKFNDGDSFNKPSSIDVNDNFIVVADTGNNRVVVFDKDFKFVHEITNVDAPGLDSSFIPTQVGISMSDNLYIIAQGVFEGIITTTIDGDFIKYTGTNEVDITLSDRLWRSVASKEQLSQMQEYLPTEFTSLSIDKEGFIYTTTTSDEKEPIKRLNTNGENVLVYPKGMAPQGDLIVDQTRGVTQLSAIDVNDNGYYAVIDSTTGRIFVYDQEGYLLSIYGNSGLEGDHFRTPVALSWYGTDKLLVADKINQEVVVLEATDFLKTVLEATRAYYKNDMDTAQELWQKALNYNSNYELAYLGLGRVYMRTGEYSKAADNFKLANDKIYYSKAFKEIRSDFFENHFVVIAATFILVLVLLYRALGDGKNE